MFFVGVVYKLTSKKSMFFYLDPVHTPNSCAIIPYYEKLLNSLGMHRLSGNS